MLRLPGEGDSDTRSPCIPALPSFAACLAAVFVVMSFEQRLILAIEPRYGREIGERTFASLPEHGHAVQQQRSETGQQELERQAVAWLSAGGD